MKKFVFLYQGMWDPSDQAMKDAWTNWFGSISDSIVDGGNPLGAGREVTPTGTIDLPLTADSTTGYTIVNADNLDDAERLLKDCPIVTGVRVYEAMSM
ncbi:MAG: hypothetical protein OEM22_05810 [Acidimicrobiia bacterium]|nr:hypothetical protein [Acidimicrobiia bacterium]MDH3469965.1 hypothetical protein [Acidimicrobiia bacterium]